MGFWNIIGHGKQHHPEQTTKPNSVPLCRGCGEAILTTVAFEPAQTMHYCKTCRTKIVYDGYTRKELSEAFDAVKDQRNWKSLISTTFVFYLPQETVRQLDAAIVFYTGSKPIFEFRQDGKTSVMAPGYYQSVGA